MHADAVVEALAALLLARREELGLSMAELATRAGITYQHISLIEKGRRCPTVDSLTRSPPRHPPFASRPEGLANQLSRKALGHRSHQREDRHHRRASRQVQGHLRTANPTRTTLARHPRRLPNLAPPDSQQTLSGFARINYSGFAQSPTKFTDSLALAA
jgi:hypothetical protein